MFRGMFDFINTNKVYNDSEKTWWVELQQTDCIWYDMLLSPPDEIDTRHRVLGRIQQVEKLLKDNFEKRFIYFLCSRKKVRFATQKKPHYSLINKNLIIYLLIGKDNIRKKLSIPVLSYVNGKVIKTTPKVRVTEKYIYLNISPSNTLVYSVHDFLKEHNIKLGLFSEVHYVGYTKNPQSRPTNGIHRGVMEMFYKHSNDDNDFFIHFHLFSPKVCATNNDYNVNFTIANAVIDEIEIDKEGRIIEKCFIKYFNTEIQKLNLEKEKQELSRNLGDMLEKHKIKDISIDLQYKKPNEYFTYYSKSVECSGSHFFHVKREEGDVYIDRKAEREVYFKKLLNNEAI